MRPMKGKGQKRAQNSVSRSLAFARGQQSHHRFLRIRTASKWHRILGGAAEIKRKTRSNVSSRRIKGFKGNIWNEGSAGQNSHLDYIIKCETSGGGQRGRFERKENDTSLLGQRMRLMGEKGSWCRVLIWCHSVPGISNNKPSSL